MEVFAVALDGALRPPQSANRERPWARTHWPLPCSSSVWKWACTLLSSPGC